MSRKRKVYFKGISQKEYDRQQAIAQRKMIKLMMQAKKIKDAMESSKTENSQSES